MSFTKLVATTSVITCLAAAAQAGSLTDGREIVKPVDQAIATQDLLIPTVLAGVAGATLLVIGATTSSSGT